MTKNCVIDIVVSLKYCYAIIASSATAQENLSWYSVLRSCSHRHKYEYEFGFGFTSECFVNKTTIFHCVVNNFPNCRPLAVNNSTMTLVLTSHKRHSLYKLN